MKNKTTEGNVAIIEAIDGDNHAYPFAVSVIDSESEENYNWVLDNAMKHPQMKELLNNRKTVLYSDRGKGLRKSLATKCPNARKRACFKHIIRNLIRDKWVSAGYLHRSNKCAYKYSFGNLERLLWNAQEARHKEGFDHCINQMNSINPRAAQWIKRIDPKLFANYTLFDSKSNPSVRTYYYSTSNIVEQEMGRFKHLKLRTKTPREIFDGVIALWIRLYKEGIGRVQSLIEKQQLVTNYAYEYFQLQKKFSHHLNVHSTNGETSFFVDSPSKKGVVLEYRSSANFELKLCSTGCWFMMGIICMHGIANARLTNTNIDNCPFSIDFVKHCFNWQWHTTTYAKCYLETNRVCMSTKPIIERHLLPWLPVVRLGRPKISRMKGSEEGGKSYRRGKTRRQRNHMALFRKQTFSGMSLVDPDEATEEVSDGKCDADSDATDDYADCIFDPDEKVEEVYLNSDDDAPRKSMLAAPQRRVRKMKKRDEVPFRAEGFVATPPPNKKLNKLQTPPRKKALPPPLDVSTSESKEETATGESTCVCM